MFIHHSPNLKWNPDRAYYTWHIHQDWTMQPWDKEYLHTHTGLAQCGFRIFNDNNVTGLCRWYSGRLRHRFCSRLSVSVRWRCTCALAPPAYLRILCSATSARKATICLIFTNHSQVSLPYSLHLFMPWKLNSPRLLSLDIGTRVLDHMLHFLYCGAQKSSLWHFAYIQGKADVWLF